MIANTIIKSVFRKAFIKDGSFTPSVQQYADGLERLNDMINTWSANNNLVYEDTMEELTIPAATQSITIGSTGTLAVARPLEIRVATLKTGSTEYSLKLIDEKQYNSFSNKSSIGLPSRLYYRNTWPNGTLYFEYTTDIQYTLTLTSLKQLAEFSDGTTDNPLPDHYEKAFKDNLLIEMADELGIGNRVTPLMIKLAEDSKTAIIGQALDLVPSQTELRSSYNYNIEGDTY